MCRNLNKNLCLTLLSYSFILKRLKKQYSDASFSVKSLYCDTASNPKDANSPLGFSKRHVGVFWRRNPCVCPQLRLVQIVFFSEANAQAQPLKVVPKSMAAMILKTSSSTGAEGLVSRQNALPAPLLFADSVLSLVEAGHWAPSIMSDTRR